MTGPTDPALRALRERVISAMPWYDESNPDYTELDAVLSAALAAEAAPLDTKDETNLIRIRYQKVYVLGHPMADVIAWKSFYDAHQPDPHTPSGFVVCPLCHKPERDEDMVTGVCLSCADAIAWGQNARRGAVNVP